MQALDVQMVELLKTANTCEKHVVIVIVTSSRGIDSAILMLNPYPTSLSGLVWHHSSTDPALVQSQGTQSSQGTGFYSNESEARLVLSDFRGERRMVEYQDVPLVWNEQQ